MQLHTQGNEPGLEAKQVSWKALPIIRPHNHNTRSRFITNTFKYKELLITWTTSTRPGYPTPLAIPFQAAREPIKVLGKRGVTILTMLPCHFTCISKSNSGYVRSAFVTVLIAISCALASGHEPAKPDADAQSGMRIGAPPAGLWTEHLFIFWM
jgi:hypothetical protein